MYGDTEDDQETTNLGGGLPEELADDALDPLISRMDLPVDYLLFGGYVTRYSCHIDFATSSCFISKHILRQI